MRSCWVAATCGSCGGGGGWFDPTEPAKAEWSFVIVNDAAAMPLCGARGLGVVLRLRARAVAHCTKIVEEADRAQGLCGVGFYNQAAVVGGALAHRALARQQQAAVDAERSGGAVAGSTAASAADAGGSSTDDGMWVNHHVPPWREEPSCFMPICPAWVLLFFVRGANWRRRVFFVGEK